MGKYFFAKLKELTAVHKAQEAKKELRAQQQQFLA
jgi:hypothetical protein